MTTLVIQTQYRENYAAHNEGYEHGVDEPHWKFKGGTTYLVHDLTEKNINAIAKDGIKNIEKLITYSNPASEEYVLDYEIREDGHQGDPVCQPWETPVELWYDFSTNEWKARTLHYGTEEYPLPTREGIRAKAEQWTLGLENTRNEYQCQYKTANGWFDQNDPKLREELGI
tara:strand:- start:8850 stop:9362 length:513 start_codon:yes stop_codon:yes gene_type:complete